MFKHALIIDPSPTDTQQTKQKLKDLGVCKITVAGRLVIGLEELSTVHKEPIDLVLLDIDQPDAADQDSVAQIRASKLAKDAPLVALCTAIEPNTMFACLSVGADEFVDKQTFLSDKLTYILFVARHRRQIKAFQI